MFHDKSTGRHENCEAKWSKMIVIKLW